MPNYEDGRDPYLIFNDIPDESVYLGDHICPACGAVVNDVGGNYDDDPMKQVCYDCGWEGEWQYD